MRTESNSSFDNNVAEHRDADPGPALYALISDHGGPCSVVGDYDSLGAAVEAARTIDTDASPTDLEDDLDVDASNKSTDWLIERAEAQGWRVVAQAPAGEHWTVMVAPDFGDAF